MIELTIERPYHTILESLEIMKAAADIYLKTNDSAVTLGRKTYQPGELKCVNYRVDAPNNRVLFKIVYNFGQPFETSEPNEPIESVEPTADPGTTN